MSAHEATFGQEEASVDGDLPGLRLPGDHGPWVMIQIPTRYEGFAEADAIEVLFQGVLVGAPLGIERQCSTVRLQVLPKD